MSKKTLIIIAGCIVLITFFILCNSTSTNLTGRWELTEGRSSFAYLEFFSNGSYTSSRSNYEGDYQVDGNRLLLEGDLMDDIVLNFRIKGKTLNFYYDDGELASVFEKK